MSRLLLGVDGGASKTVALIVDVTGKVVGAGRSGSSDIHNEASPQVAVDHVVTSVREAAATAGARPVELEASVLGLCGADWPEDVVFYMTTLRERLALRHAPTVVNDAFNALRAGSHDGIGVALVMGTGAAVAARGPDGASWFSGERMERAGAMEFGRRAYDLILRGEYGSAPRPAFEQPALAAYAAASVEAMVHAITRTGGHGHRSLARLAPVLLEAGHRGDPTACAIVLEQARLLAGYVRRAAERVGLDPLRTRVVQAGGIFKHHCTDLADGISAALPGATITAATMEPVHGAILMAADGIGVRPDPEQMLDTGPEASFFDTV